MGMAGLFVSKAPLQKPTAWRPAHVQLSVAINLLSGSIRSINSMQAALKVETFFEGLFPFNER